MKQRKHIPDETCWCQPLIEEVEGGILEIHNDEIGVLLGLHPRLLAETPSEDKWEVWVDEESSAHHDG